MRGRRRHRKPATGRSGGAEENHAVAVPRPPAQSSRCSGPGRTAGRSHTVCAGPPEASTFFSLPCTANPMKPAVRRPEAGIHNAFRSGQRPRLERIQGADPQLSAAVRTAHTGRPGAGRRAIRWRSLPVKAALGRRRDLEAHKFRGGRLLTEVDEGQCCTTPDRKRRGDSTP